MLLKPTKTFFSKHLLNIENYYLAHMSNSMNWEQLLSLKRQGDTNKRLRNEQDETRLGFDVDYDRIIFSTEFRSLQDKTQVIPLSSTDFVHTRLTHSLEVSVVARSLGRKAGVKLLEKHPALQEIHGYKPNDFGAIVAAAALPKTALYTSKVFTVRPAFTYNNKKTVLFVLNDSFCINCTNPSRLSTRLSSM